MAACPDLVGAGFSHAAAGAMAGFMGFQNRQRLPQAQNVVGAGFSHAAAGPLSGFMGFQN